jgi:galactokinase/mevalonate kinase-like predicted kinase
MPEGQVRGWELVSAEQISSQANLRRLTAQRKRFRALNWPSLAENHRHSVFFQTDLGDAAQDFAANNIAVPQPISEDNPLLTRVHDNMFRAEVKRLRGEDDTAEAQEAFRLLRQGLTETVKAEIENQKSPRMSVYGDQIVWGRSPVRIDIAGGWTDTPPYCLMEGGNVINLAIELNGQPPLQAYVKPCKERHIILRSIDLGASEVVKTYEELADFYHVGSPFSIPKAALVLAGFQPGFCIEKFESLEKQLEAFGCGMELTMLSAIPAGSGLGTSSILASTVLGALNDFCGLAWDKQEIGRRTLVLEQLLTTGGGWQDQFGGLLQGIKLLQTKRGFDQSPTVHWLPSELYTQPEYRQCHLLYYTGITRTAKTLLAEIVRRMFLNNHDEIALLRDMKEHTLNLYETIQRNDFVGLGKAIRKTWAQNQAIDGGTNPTGVKAISDMVDDLCLGYKLPGAGGGGYLYMVAKDPDAAARIRQILNASPQNANARFVDMTLSEKGLQVSRS